LPACSGPLYARQKEGVPKDSLSENITGRLEGELQCELELAHASGRTWRGVSFDVGDVTVAGAVDTCSRTGLVRIEAVDRMIEQVERIHAELRLHALGDGEVLHDRSVTPEPSRTSEGVKADVAELPAARHSEPWTGGSG